MIKTILYWVTTVLVAAAYLFGGVVDAVQPEGFAENFAKLGYPMLFFTILGIWKVGAGIVILSPGLPRLKEWAYAGITINLTAAAATHIHAQDYGDLPAPMMLLGLAAASWALRPASRRLSGPWL